MSADWEMQKAIRARLTTTLAVTDKVPAVAILDRNERPAPRPSIILGQSQVVDEGTSLKRQHHRIYHDIHVWVKEPSTETAKAITWAIRQAIHSARLTMFGAFHCADARVSSTRHMRDPDGETSHSVVTVDALVVETMP
jgi:hypothetical protein